MPRISVLLTPEEEARFAAYCKERGFKKSTLIARLIREHLNREGYAAQISLSLEESKISKRAGRSQRQSRRK